MPIYAYKCAACGREQDEFNKVDDRDNGPTCCAAAMGRRLTAAMVTVRAFESYKCPMTDQVIHSERQRRYTMEQNNVVDSRELTDTWARKKAADRQEKAELKEYMDSIPESVKQAAAETAPL